MASAWRAQLQPASYNGITFYVRVQTRVGGNRLVAHEFPKKNIPWTENMGRRVRRWPITGYLVYSPVHMPDVFGQRDALLEELENGQIGTLILPTGLHKMSDEPPGAVEVETFGMIERQEEGGYVELEMMFVEAGQPVSSQPFTYTPGNVVSAAQNATTAFAGSNDITDPVTTPQPGAGSGGIGAA